MAWLRHHDRYGGLASIGSAQFGPDGAGGGDHVSQGRNHFLGPAGLEAAVGVDPDAVTAQRVGRLPDEGSQVGRGRDVGRVDVEDTRADRGRVADRGEVGRAPPWRERAASTEMTSASSAAMASMMSPNSA